ncbi:hypothetical protein MIZ03_3004 [Rhodoferax lithotrophicus]|uniref:DUF4124 domain-containing protein n=1 Tax=Rhodoferax lithotrophicus TaxID=2798804 RepID=A0ABM7MPC7_9BURK|nr:hypothetical protein [Rhodoferax sp. MIZ03]BCO28108.1 hypothetical protein MIZ03_3004 [Rhodoferax sp. MIZ03]
MVFDRTVKWGLVFLLLLIIIKLGWSHRHDDWVQQWLVPQGPAKVDIQFDNGSVRDSASPNDGAGKTMPKLNTVKNEPGQLKKCLIDGKVVYTDQVCPTGAKVAAVDGGTLAVLPAPKATADHLPPTQGGQKRLREVLDISDGQDQKTRMMERVVNP